MMYTFIVAFDYTVTVNNTGTKTRKIKHRVKTGAHYTLVGMRENSSAAYDFKDTKKEKFTRGDMAKIIYEAKQRNMF